MRGTELLDSRLEHNKNSAHISAGGQAEFRRCAMSGNSACDGLVVVGQGSRGVVRACKFEDGNSAGFLAGGGSVEAGQEPST